MNLTFNSSLQIFQTLELSVEQQYINRELFDSSKMHESESFETRLLSKIARASCSRWEEAKSTY